MGDWLSFMFNGSIPVRSNYEWELHSLCAVAAAAPLDDNNNEIANSTLEIPEIDRGAEQ